ncbi:MAG: hypothetical protein EXS17_03095 [Phycisphaerales bacterium]|nr:hypothetical protein [Phycisphaerales bacterium]
MIAVRTIWALALAAASALTMAITGASVHAVSTAQSASDPTLAMMREEDFLRGISDFGLERALDDLDRSEPAPAATDAATAQLRAVARWRMTLRLPSTTYSARLAALEQLRNAREALIAAHPRDARVALWLVDGAEDELVLGFLGLDGGAEAIAGSPLVDVPARGQASLARVKALLTRVTGAQATGAAVDLAPDSALAQRLAHDGRGRRPFLAAAVEAFAMAIDRSRRDMVVERGRPAAAAPVHAAIVEVRPRIPARLRPEADLAEVAAAAVALRLDDARFGAARILLSNDPVLATLSRILVADALVNERHGNEAVQQLIALNMSANMPTGLRLLAADAFVRTCVTMGKSPADPTTLEAWIVTLRNAMPSERAAVRRAVLGRIAGALRGVAVVGTLPPLAVIARSGDALGADASAAAAEEALRVFAAQSADSQVQAAALVVLADAYSAHGEWGRAADMYRLFAQCAAQEPSAATAIETALDIEVALDRARPDARTASFEATLRLALTNFAELPTRSRSAAQLLALEIMRSTDRLTGASGAASRDAADEMWANAVRLRDLDESAQAAGFDAGPRIDGAIALATIAADLLAPNDPPRAAGPPSLAQWNGWTTTDAQRILQLRLDRAALQEDGARAAFQRELEAIPPSLLTSETMLACPTLVQFLQRLVANAQALQGGASESARAVALRALEAAEVWEQLHPPADLSPTDADARAICVVAADAALIAHAWDAATARAHALAAHPTADRGDLLRLAQALSQAAGALDGTADTARRDALRNEAMNAARLLATKVARGSAPWWTAQVIQIQMADASGRGGEPLQARLARLRALDPDLGGEPSKSALEKFAPAAPRPAAHEATKPI